MTKTKDIKDIILLIGRILLGRYIIRGVGFD